MALIILAGGRGSRLNMDKGQLVVGGVRLITALVGRLRGAGQAIVVTATPEVYRDLPVLTVGDRVAGFGPLGGIEAGLAASPDEANLVVACDLPFVSPALAHRLLAALERGYDAAVPCPGGWPEPTCAAYARSCLPAIRRRIAEGAAKVTGFYESVRVLRLADEELLQYGPPQLMFQNINTAEDLARAEAQIPEARRLGCWT